MSLTVLQDVVLKHIDEHVLTNIIFNSMHRSQYDILKELLMLKYGLIIQKKHELLYFPVHYLLESKDFLNSNYSTDILIYALLIQEDSKEFLYFENFINKQLSSIITNNDQILIIFKLLDVTFTLIENHHFKVDIDREKSFCAFYKAVCNGDTKQFMYQINVTTKRLVSKISVNNLLYCLEAVLVSNNTEVLCCIIEYFLLCSLNSEICSLLLKYNIFDKCSTLIMSYETTNQRQGTFLLQQIKYYVINNELYETTDWQYIKLPQFDIEIVEGAWNAFFTLSSICREKQIHLVKPALMFLNDLYYLHPLWVKTMYSIVFCHAQNEVVSHAVVNILNSNWFKSNENFLLLCKKFVETLSKIDYSDATIDGFTALGQYINRCSDEVFWKILKESRNISWNPINMWLFCKNIFKREQLKELNIVEINKYILCLQKLPHKYIRNGCIQACFNFIKALSDFLYFEDLLKLARVVKDTDISLKHFSDTFLCLIRKNKFEIEQEIKKWKPSLAVPSYEFEILLQFLKTFDHPEEVFSQFSLLVFPHIGLLKILNNFDVLIESVDSLIIFNCLEISLEYCDKETFHDAKSLLEKLSLKTNYCKQHSNEIAHICSLAKSFMYNTDVLYVERYEIAVEVLKHFDKQSLRSSDVYNKIVFTSNGHISIGLLEMLFKDASNDSVIKLIGLIEMIYEKGSDEIVAAVFKNCEFLLTKAQDEDICKFLEISLNYILSLNRGEQFKRILEAYLKIFPSVILEREVVSNKCYKITHSLLQLSNKCTFINNVLTAHLRRLVEDCPHDALMYKHILVECLLKDACIRKEELSEYNVCKDIHGMINRLEDYQYGFSYINELVLSRYLIFESILHLINNEQLPIEAISEFADNLAYNLIEKYKVHLNKRYFKDSMIHIQKLRIIQLLLLLQPYLVASRKELKSILIASICEESHQYCVRQLIAWLLIRLQQEDEKGLETIIGYLEAPGAAMKISSITTLIIILYHLTLLSAKEYNFSNTIDLLLPWTMGANFKLRVYAQIAVLKLYEKAEEYKFVKTLGKHKNIYSCIESIILKATESVQSALQTDEIMFSFFDVLKYYSLETILIHIPKINHVTYTEWEGYIHLSESKQFNSIKIKNVSNEFESYYKEPMKGSALNESKSTDNFDIIQRKITPWTEISQNKEQIKQLTKLIVVAVFVDKAANIGGLSRTCEIFGVQQLVVHDAKIINDKEYKSLSMCSEGWLNILEVQQKDIKDYLIKMKLEDYNIVAVEQTSNSVHLHKFAFQEKTVLILGNEKEGIPANVLPLADTCVEIPQMGVTRSLNVHVAGSLFIWEYSKAVLVFK